MNTTYGFCEGSLEKELELARARVAMLESKLRSVSGADDQMDNVELCWPQQDQYLRLIENIEQGVLVVDQNYRTVFVNQVALDILESTRTDFDALSFFRLVPDSVQEQIYNIISNSMFSEALEKLECELELASGRDLCLQLKLVPVLGYGSSHDWTQIVITDATNERKVKQDLERSKKFHKALFDGAGDAIFVHDSEGTFVDANKVACKRFGYSRHELLNMSLEDIKKEKSCAVFARIAEIGDDSQPFLEVEQCTRNGDKFSVEINSRTVDFNGEKRILTIARDVTERVKADKRSALNRKRIKALYEMSHLSATSVPAFFEFAIRKGLELSQSELGFITQLEGHGSDTGFKNWISMDRFGDNEILTVPEGLACCGEWKNVLLRRSGMFENELDSDVSMYPLPDNKIYNYIVFPIIDGGRVVAVAVLANKEGGYDNDARRNIGLLLDGMWSLACKKKSEQQVRISLREKETLLKEVHHRVKNNMQVICSLLNLQTDYINDPQDLTLIRHSIDRVRSMAYVHEQLYRSDNLSSIDFGQYISGLGISLISSYGAAEKVHFSTKLEAIKLPIEQALPCGLIVNELITNAIAHAFPDKLKNQTNRLNVELSLNEGTVTMIVADNGIGIEGGLERSGSLGHVLIDTLVQQIDGSLQSSSDNGAQFNLSFRLKK